MTSRFVLVMLLVVAVTAMFPSLASAQTQNSLVLEINTVNDYINSKTNPDNSADTVKTPQVDPNIAILQDYLQKKGSPLAPYAEQILENDNWKLVLAISNGESTMCKRQMYNNCWGVGGAWNLKRYKSFAEGFSDVDDLLTRKYLPDGKDTPKEIVRRYVGSYSPTWVLAVSKTLNELDQLPLAN